MTNTTAITRPLRRPAALLGASLVLVASLAGCSTSPAPEVQTTTEMTKERATALAADFTTRVEKSQDAFKDCVVDKGIDLDSVSTSEDPRMDEVMDLCTTEVGETPVPTAEEQAGIRYLNQLTLDCLRDKGHEVDDLQPDGSLPNTGDRDDAYFADVDACEADNG